MPDTMFFMKLRVLLCGWRWTHHRRASWLKAQLRRARHRMSRLARTVHTSSSRLIQYSAPSTQHFLLEPLEARVLLAADLTGVVQSAAVIDPAVPTNTASAVVRVQNVGNQNVSQSQVGVYASLDNALDSSDLLLGTANTGSVNAGAAKNVTVNLTFPSTLNPVPYKLLAKVDNANAIAENSEGNNVAIGGTINGIWKFGAVPGRTGNTTLTLRDADGTTVTFRLTGPGTGKVIRDGSQWDVKITGTTASSAVTILTNGSGNGRVTLNDIHVFGPLATFLAATTDLTGTLAIDGPVNIPGLLPGTITLGSIQGGTVAVPSVEALTIVDSTTNAKFYIGTTLGQDGQPGGTGANADTYGVGMIGLFTVTGAMTGTTVRVGINPVDGTYGNGNDQLIGGSSSSIGGIIIGGSLSADTRFYAGSFPTQYLNGLTLKPTAGDVHFVSNFSGPTLTAALDQDTGSSATDKLTNNPAITGSLTDPQGIATFTAGFGATPTFNILADRQANGSFALSPARLEQIDGGPLTDGTLTLTLRATDSAGNVTQITAPFTLDTQAPVLTVDLDPASDTAPVGDQQTTNATVTLVGQTEANALIELVGLGRTTTADAGGSYSFANVALVTGANTFTVRATDQAGNQRATSTSITRLSSNQPPVLDPIGNKTVDEGAGLRFTVTGSDADVPAQSLIYGATGLPDGATFDPATHEFVWTPTDAQGPGTYDVTFSLGDGVATVSEVVTITVTELNQAPVLSLIGNRSAIEGTLLTFDASVVDEDVPNQVGTYSLENGSGGAVPVGASIDASSGVFSWGTTEAQGPGTYTFDVVVTDNGVPALSDRETITVTVTESNLAPGLSVPTSVSGDEQSLVTFTAVGTDGDLPANQLTFSLQGTVPDGATIDPLTGVFTWTPTEAQGPGVYDITVRVTDSGVPSAFIERTVRLTIGDANQSPTITSASSVAVPENQTAIMTVTASDADIPAQPLTFSVTGGADAAAFVFTTGGALSFVTAPNFELPSDANHDNVYEVTVQVSDGAGGIATQNVNVTVTNVVETVPTLSISDVTLAEGTSVSGSTAFNFAVTLSEPVNETVTVQVATSDNGATAASGDYTPVPPTTLTFGPGETTKPVTVQVRQDDRVEGNEQFQVSLSNATNATILDGSGFGTITNDDVRTLSINDVTQTEGTSPSGFTAYTFTVTLSAPTLTTDVTVQVATSDNGATAASGDYTPVPPTTLTFGPGETTKPVTVQVRQDDRVEGNEQFQVSLSNATNATILDGAGFGTILDDDVRTVTIDDVTVTEGNAGTAVATFTVTLSQASSGIVTVLATTAADSATPGLDYTSNSQTLTFAPGTTQQTFSVPIISDLLLEPTEQFFVNLSNVSGTVVIADAQGIGTILDNDVNQAPVLTPVGNQTVNEGQLLQFNANATDPDGLTTFTYSLENGVSGQVPAGAVIAGGTGLFSWTPTEAQGPGSYTFDVVVTDNGTPALIARETITVTVDEVNQGPTLQIIPDQVATAGQLLTFTAVGTDPDIPANSLTYSLQGVAPAGATIDSTTGIFSWTPTNAEVGPQSLTVRVTDNDAPSLFAQQIVSIAVAPKPNQAPVLAPIVGHEVAFEGVETRFTLSATDADSPTSVLRYSATGLPEGATLDALTGEFRWTPTEAQGGQGYQTTFTVTDEQEAQDSQLVAFIAMEVNNFAPIANPDSVPTPLDTPVTITAASLLANDTDADNQANGQELAIVRVGAAQFGTLELTTVPDAVLGLKLDTIRYTPNAGFEGVETISYEINELGDIQVGSSFPLATLDANVVGTLTIVVGNPQANQPPVLNAIGNRTVNAGQQLTLIATAADTLAQQLTFSLQEAIPSGAAVDSTTGVFTWQPTAAQAGVHSVTIRVTDDGSPALFDEETFTITVGAELTTSFQGLGDLPGGTTVSFANGVSADGTVVVGTGNYNNNFGGEEAFLWTSGGGLVGLGNLSGSISGSAALDVSADGSVVIGQYQSSAGAQAFRWTASEGMVGLGDLPGGSFASGARAVSADGSVVVGTADPGPGNFDHQAFRWTSSTGLVALGTLSNDASLGSEAFDVSADGSVVVGRSYLAFGTGYQAFRWTNGTGMVGLGGLLGTVVSSEANAVSADGSVVVGTAVSMNAPLYGEAFRWTASGGMIGLGTLPGDNFSTAFAASGDGSRILGVSGFIGGPTATSQLVVWDAAHGMRSLAALLAADLGLGTSLSGWTLSNVTGVSADGRVIVGNGTNPLGQPEAWRAVLPAVLPVNQAPILNPIGDQTVDEGATLTFTASAADSSPYQSLTYSLQGAVPTGASINANSGLFTWTPTENQGPGSYTFDVVVRDNSSILLTDSETITVTVNDVDENPVLNAIGNQSVNEGDLLSFTATATAFNQSQVLVFSLEGTAPTGAGINSSSGLFTWTPAEPQGPGTYQVTVRVSDANAPARFDEETITIAVAEVNRAPVLAPIADQTVTEGQPVSFTASATDADVPTNALTFTLEGTAPASATIDSVTGQFSWTPAAGEAGSYQFTVRVTDNGTPAFFSEQTVNVTVLSTAASFQGLGDLPGGGFSSRPFGVSGNGAVVVGESEGTTGLESFRWTVGGGLQDLATVVGTSAVGRAASFDGAVIVGDSDAGSFRWSVVDGFQTIVGNAALHSANAVTADGSVVVGKGQVNVFTPQGAFRWTAATGAVRLDSLAGYADAEAFGVSADGNVIVGASYFGPSGEEAQAVRWVADGLGGFTAEALGDLPGGNFMSRAVAVSADGTLIFGISESDRGQEAFIWTATGGMQGLGDGTGDLRAMSADGSVIVGGSYIWDANNGIRSLSQVFTESGIAGFESWSMNALGVSADGRTIVGEGTNPDGNQEGWRVVLPVNTAPPVFNTVPAGLYPVQAGQAFTFTVSAFDPAGQLVQYRLLGNVPSGVNFPGGDFSWTPSNDDVGSHSFTIRAYDNGVPSRFIDTHFTISVTA